MSILRAEIDDEFLVCVFCEKLALEPFMLPCLHSICVTCKKKAFSGSLTCISCTKCKEKITVSEPGNLPLNYWLRNVTDVINITECSDGLICSFCELKGKKHEALARCMTCFDLLCKECWEKYHTFTTQTRNHKVVSVKELKSGHFDWESNHQISCVEHSQEFLRIYCNTCAVPVCQDCVFFQHKSHVFLSIEEAIEKFGKGLYLEKERIEKDLSHLKTRHLKSVEQIKNIDHCEENIKLKIETTCNSMINKINTRRRSLERELIQSLKNPKEILERNTESEEKKIRLLSATLSFYNTMLKYGNAVEILILQRTVMQRMSQISSSGDDNISFDYKNIIPRFTASWTEPNLEFTYDTGLNDKARNNTVDRKVLVDKAHQTDFETKSNDKENDVSDTERDFSKDGKDVVQESISRTTNRKLIRSADVGIQCNNTVDRKVLADKAHQTDFETKSNDKEKGGNTDADVQCNFIVDNEFHKETNKNAHDISYTFVQIKCLSNIHRRPKISCISWINKTSFLAIDQSNNSVHFCSLASPGNPMIVENCVDSTVTSWCFAIRTGSSEILVFERNSSSFLFRESNVSVVAAVSSLSHILAWISKSTISIKKGKKAQLKCLSLRNKEGNSFCMENPRFVCVLSSGKFAVSDWEKDFVFLFDENAVIFRKEFCCPGSIATDQKEHIYVADFFEHCIIITNFEGSFRKRIDLLPYVFHPRSISISPDNKLAVAFENSIALFQMSDKTNQLESGQL